MSKTNLVVIEVDTPQNSNVLFRPEQKTVRGKFDLHRVKEPNAGKLHSLWPEPIPGQQISLDLISAEGCFVDPLYDEKFQAIRERIEGMGQKLPPQREVFQGADIATWVFYMRELVNSGKAKLIEGEFPKIDETKVQRRFFSTERPDTNDRLVAAIERQNELMGQLLNKLVETK